MATDEPVYTYLVNQDREITLTIPFDNKKEGMQFTIQDPKLTPGSVVNISPIMMEEIIAKFLDYTQTGIAPDFAFERARK